MLKKIKNLVVQEEGQAMTEYGLIIALIAVVVMAAVTVLGTEIKATFNEIVTKFGGTPAT
jgi:pilus assembly protein Flp/PilA